MSSLTAHLRSTILCGLFLIGTLGIPIADAAMFHVAEQDPCAGVTHVEAHGGQHHADRCTLAQPAAAQREALGSTAAVRVGPPQSDRTPTAAVGTPAAAAPITLQHSRAPPA